MYRVLGKRLIDIATSFVLLLLFLPVLLMVAVAVWCWLGRPTLFRQQRRGLYGEPFTLFKFRTMTDARDANGDLLPDAARLTPLGQFLRKTSLDELPQLWNVLRGEMSLAGPRPLLLEYLPYYSDREMTRHNVRPGLTGLAQVNGRNVTTWDKRLELDVQYVERLSFSLDVKILLATFWQVVRRCDVVAVPGSIQGKLDVLRARSCNRNDIGVFQESK